MARAALNWTVRDLAQATGLHRKTVPNIEVGRYAGTEDSIALIESVFGKAGIEFLPQSGIRFHEPPNAGHEGRYFCGGLVLAMAILPVFASNRLQACSLRR